MESCEYHRRGACMNDERVSDNLDLSSPSRILPSKRCGAELRRQNIRTSALPARKVRRLTLMGESLTEACQLRPLYWLVLRVVLENWNRAGHHWRGASAWNRANIIGEVRV